MCLCKVHHTSGMFRLSLAIEGILLAKQAARAAAAAQLAPQKAARLCYSAAMDTWVGAEAFGTLCCANKAPGDLCKKTL